MSVAEHATRRSSSRSRAVPRPAARAVGSQDFVAAFARVSELLGDPPIPIDLWDGTHLGPPEGPGRLLVRSPDVLSYLLWAPGELGLGRAFVAGHIDVEGDVFAVLHALQGAIPNRSSQLRALPDLVAVAHSLGVLGRPPVPAEEARVRGRVHSRRRDAASISHHYDVGNDFYALVLGPAMAYSCARFVETPDDPSSALEAAQEAKHELVCRKLGLHERPGARLLDVGCGWGSMAIHAASHHAARVVAITISREQAAAARRRADSAGVSELVDVRLQDVRDVADGPYDAVSSIGMSEHVGASRIEAYFESLRGLLADEGRLLNHAISSVGGSRLGRRSFAHRYVFPDGELLDVGDTQLAMERAGLEVRDVESLREHYALTLRAWVGNLQRQWADAVALVGERRARVWLLYMAASAIGFEDGSRAIHQVLGVASDSAGRSGMPPTRSSWETT